MSTLLPIALECTVILRIAEIKNMGYVSDYLLESVTETSDLIAYSGDSLLFDNKEASAIFNKLAIAIAVLSFQTGYRNLWI